MEFQEQDENIRELHEALVPSALRASCSYPENLTYLHFYYIKFVPIPEDRQYKMFGLFVKISLPKEAEMMEVDLHLKAGRIVKTGFVPSGVLAFDKDEIMLAKKFQEMFLKIILDRSEFFSATVPLGLNNTSQDTLSTFYLLLPVENSNRTGMTVDWTTVRRCLSSPVFGHELNSFEGLYPGTTGLQLLNGPFNEHDILNSLVFTPYNKKFYFVDEIAHGSNANSGRNANKKETFEEYYKRCGIQLVYLEQPILKAKPLFTLRNLLLNRTPKSGEAREVAEKFIELPPELCSLKILGFSKDIGSSLSLLPSLMHRLESLLVAIELRDTLSTYFLDASDIRADYILEALTTEKCLERLSLERFEVLGDAFLKYAVGRHCLLSHESLDEGKLTMKRSSIVNNSHLCELAIRKNLQVYIRDGMFEPSQFFAVGRSCKVVCNVNSESSIHAQQGNGTTVHGPEAINVKCTKSHRWLCRKTIADVVEALVGAFLVGSGFKAATAFLKWIGVEVDFEISGLIKVCTGSMSNMPLINTIDLVALEKIIGYRFQHRSLLLQAFVHPSYKKHMGGCYQKLEFLGDAVLEYLVTSYLYSHYPDLKPGQITDLKSLILNNNSLAHVAVWQSFHQYLIKDSNNLTGAVSTFANFLHLSESERDLLEEPACPKVLGDIVESCFGAILLDTGFNLKQVWRIMCVLLEPLFNFSSFQINPVRELRELCQHLCFKLGLPDAVKDTGGYFVKVEVVANGTHLTHTASNHNSKAARRMAAQQIISELKARGYENKRNSLEEIVRVTRKEEPKLIGYNEDPMLVDNKDSVELKKLMLNPEDGRLELPPHERDAVSKDSLLELLPHEINAVSSPPKNMVFDTSTTDLTMPDSGMGINTRVVTDSIENGGMSVGELPNDDAECRSHTGGKDTKTAKARLFEICAANHWNAPLFVLCEEEGPSSQKRFKYKVTVEVDTITTTVLESFSEPQSQKKSAQDNAAEGALWFLGHLGYT